MKYTMLVKCEKCGYENFPQHRYCGMCAAELRIPGPGGAEPPREPAPPPRRLITPPLPPPKPSSPTTVSGPSFLGLANEPGESRTASYLLEDEPEPRRGRYLLLVLLLAGMAAAGWHWRNDLRSWGGRLLTVGEGGPPSTATSTPTQATPTAPASTSTGTPVTNANPGVETQNPNGGASDQGAAAQAQAPASAPAPAASTPEATAPEPAVPSQAETQPSEDQAENGKTKAAAGNGVRKASVRTPSASAGSEADDLEAEGEKYLYGNGVPENCGRARTNLLAAAQHSNPKAQNVLGTMYATGHCATRDLPTAYRWFSRSLRKDPNNTRIEQDLKVLWNQMTPGERQLALRNER